MYILADRFPTIDYRFLEEMGAFSKEARTQCDILQAMAKKMEELYGQLSEYLVFDRQKYTLEEFMGDIKTFKDQYKVGSVTRVTFLMLCCPFKLF